MWKSCKIKKLRFTILLRRGRLIFFAERLHDFLLRGCMIFFGKVAQFSLTRGCMIFVVERLRDFWMDRLSDVFVRRGCVMFLCGEVAWFSHSLTRVPDFFRGRIIFLWRGCVIFWRLHNFLCFEVAWFFVWRGCASFCEERLREFFVERLRDFFWGCMIWWWRGCVIFLEVA